MKRVYDDYLRDMLENAEKALEFVKGMEFDGFSGTKRVFMQWYGRWK